MAEVVDPLQTLDGPIKALSERLFKEHAKEAWSDADEFLQQSSSNLHRWIAEFARGTINTSELKFSVRSLADTAEMRALKQAGLSQVSIDAFIHGLVEIIMDALFSAASEGGTLSYRTDTRESRKSRRTVSEAEFSTSVQSAVERLGPDAPVSSWQIVKQLCKQHPEYGNGIAKALSQTDGLAGMSTQPARQWLEQARRSIIPAEDGIINGRALIVALSQLDGALAEYLRPSKFIEQLSRELGYRSPESPQDKLKSMFPPDPTPLHIDNPASADQLGRDAFAEALALRLNRIWKGSTEVGPQDDASFVLHLHGPWGSGKSSLLNLLRQHLQRNAPGEDSRPWIIVDFNAWQNQRIDPPWWPLLDGIYRQAARKIQGGMTKNWRRLMLRLRETWWRFVTANREHILLAISVVVLTAILTVITWFYWPTMANRLAQSSVITSSSTTASNPTNPSTSAAVDISAKMISAIVALAGIVAAVSAFATRSLLSGSASAAQQFMRSAIDPMQRIANHFQDLLGWIGRPVIVFIDDLDRCRSDYVVSLLEGIQTLFKDRRIVYVLSADRRWIYACYENVYDKFACAVREPGRDLGCLFLEKAVQLSVSLPRLSESLQAAFWDYLVKGQKGDAQRQMKEAAEQARSDLAGAFTPEQIAAKLKSSANPIQEHARREEAVRRLATEQAEASTEYFLKDFARLLEPNPRAMKRLLNAYALHRDMAILSGLNVLGDMKMRKQLVLWTIVCLRWPLLEQLLIDNLEYVDVINQSASTNAVPDQVRPLLKRESVKNVINGKGVGVKLDRKIIQDFAELRTSNSSSAAVG
jgi:KAP family P-loop domain